MKTKSELKELVAELRSKDGVHRERARNTLVKMGKLASKPLTELLSDGDQHVRWEACKALCAIRDPATATFLVDSLRDDNMEVQWLAAEALIALGPKAVTPLLKALEVHFDSVFLRRGALHVLHTLEREKRLNDRTLALVKTLRSTDPVTTVAWAAHKALKAMWNLDL